jgi:hypothetical protein
VKTKDLTLIAILVAILVVSQFAFSMVVGVNLVFPLLIIYTYNLGYKKTLIILLSFIGLRFLMGLPILTVTLWLWTFIILISLAHIVNKLSRGNEYIAATYALFYFMLFGFLCGVQEYILTEVPVYAYWLRGVPSDMLGAITGFITTLVLLKPLSTVIKQFSLSNTSSLS